MDPATFRSGPMDAVDPLTLPGEQDRRAARTALLILLLPTLWFQRTDFLVAAQSSALLNTRFGLRLAFLAVILAGLWWLGRLRPRQDYERGMLMLGVVTALLILGLNASRPAGSALSIRTPLVWLFAYYAGLRNRPMLQAVPPLIVSVGIALLRCLWVTGEQSGDIAGDLVVLLTVNALGIAHLRARPA